MWVICVVLKRAEVGFLGKFVRCEYGGGVALTGWARSRFRSGSILTLIAGFRYN